MKQPIALLFALRYLFSKRQINFISIISYLSVGGITLGVAALIIVLAIFNGFAGLVRSYLVSFEPHLRIESTSEDAASSLAKIDTFLKKSEYAESYSGFVEGKTAVISREYNRITRLKGISPGDGGDVYGIKQALVSGSYEFADETGSAFIGINLSEKLAVTVGDTLTILSPAGIENLVAGAGNVQNIKLVIKGVYQSKNGEYDGDYVFTGLDQAKYVLGYGDDVQGYEIRFDDYTIASGVKEMMEEKFGKDEFIFSTWYDLHSDIYNVMMLERLVAWLLLSLIILVAVFNILASLTMSVIEKKRDIGVLTSMGMERSTILKIFMIQGFLTGVAGTIAGGLLGLGIYYLQINYHIIALDPVRFKVGWLPMELNAIDYILILVASIGLSLLASIYPAKKAAAIDPIDAIRWE
ncbi:ABC transporter permease [Ignavibacteriales bacterium]